MEHGGSERIAEDGGAVWAATVISANDGTFAGIEAACGEPALVGCVLAGEGCERYVKC